MGNKLLETQKARLPKKIVIVIFDDFTDIDLFLMWDILGRNKTDWEVKILGKEKSHRSAHGLDISTHGSISEANDADVVLFSSGKKGVKAVLDDKTFLEKFSLNPQRQIIGSICAGTFILAALGLLKDGIATTHPDAKKELEALGIKTINSPLICIENVATAGGCLAAIYLVGWFVERLFGADKRRETIRDIIPTGQHDIYEELIASSIKQGIRLPNDIHKI